MIFNLYPKDPEKVFSASGTYNSTKKILSLWIYFSRSKEEGAKRLIYIPEICWTPMFNEYKIILEDQDWDYKYEMTVGEFKSAPLVNGCYEIDLNKLRKI